MTASKIQWTDETWNPVRGCVKVSAGCKNCYAETFAERWRGVPGHPYTQGFDLRLVPEKLLDPIKMKKPQRIFVNSMSDLFQDGVPFEFVDKVFAVMALCPQHTFQVLTKRARRMLEYVKSRIESWPGSDEYGKPLPNVWLGVSVENQQYADERIPPLLQTPAAKRFVSYEPALGPIDFSKLCGWTYDALHGTDFEDLNVWPDRHAHLDWVIVGGESGPGARPFDIQWARSVVQQCKDAGISCFVKQLGSNAMYRSHGDNHPSHLFNGLQQLYNNGERLASKGGDMSEWPADLRVRQFPV